MTTKRDVVEIWFRRVWKEEDPSAIDEMFAVDGEARGLGANSLIGPQGFKTFHSTLCALLSEIVISVDKSIEEGDWISVICSLTARDRKSAASVGMTGQVLVKIVDGKLIEAYNHWDFLGLFAQLGSLPTGAFERGLAGETIG